MLLLLRRFSAPLSRQDLFGQNSSLWQRRTDACFGIRVAFAKSLSDGRWLQNLAGMPWSSKVLVRGDTLLARVAKGQSQLCWRFAGKLMFYSHVRPQPGES